MRQAVQFALLAAVVVSFPWLAVSIAANLQLLPSGGSGPPSLSCSPNCPTFSQVVPQPTAGNTMVFLITLVIVLSLFVVSGIIAWERKVQTSKSVWSLLSVLLLFALVYALSGVLNIIRTISVPDLGVFNPMLYWLSFVPLVLILIAGALGVKWIAQRPGLTTSKTATATLPEEKMATVSVLDKAIHSLRSGTDPRSVVISCYRALCETLQERGVPGTPSTTAREFEVVSEKALPIRHETLHKLTALFEKARYSTEEVAPGDAAEAESVLSELKSEVLGVVGEK